MNQRSAKANCDPCDKSNFQVAGSKIKKSTVGSVLNKH